MNKLSRLLAVLILASALVSAAPAAPAAAWQEKVDARVLSEVESGPAEFLVFLGSQADLSGAPRFSTKLEKGTYVYQQLTETARRTQGPLLAELERQGVDYRPFWVANMVWVRGGAQLVQELARRPEVDHLYADPWVRLDEPGGNPPAQAVTEAQAAVEWNLERVGAPEVWQAGYTGQGVVVAGQDTGYDWEHPALKNSYRGWDGSTADHNYNWHDAIHEDNEISTGENICGFDSPFPCDDGSHGTHTMGTMVGADGDGNQVGMAPGARWIGCRNMENGWGKPSTYSECYQWFIAPTDLNDQNPDPARAPDVINNSWSCPPEEGCTDPLVLKAAVDAVRAAGIVTVHSAGNTGPACSTLSDPAAIYAASFTVGATDYTEPDQPEAIAYFSSRGPVTSDGSGRLKPNISAPGVNIRSSVPGGGYTWMQGTSMAGPHVAGLVALLISADPALAGYVGAIETLIQDSAVHLETEEDCGGTAGQVPNNVFGWGRIDAWAAFWQNLPEYNLAFTPPRSGLTRPGKSVTYTHLLKNTGRQQDTYDLTFSSSQGWKVEMASSITLQSMEEILLTVTVHVPPDAPTGAIDQTEVTITSRAEPAVATVLTDTTQAGYETYLMDIFRNIR